MMRLKDPPLTGVLWMAWEEDRLPLGRPDWSSCPWRIVVDGVRALQCKATVRKEGVLDQYGAVRSVGALNRNESPALLLGLDLRHALIWRIGASKHVGVETWLDSD